MFETREDLECKVAETQKNVGGKFAWLMREVAAVGGKVDALFDAAGDSDVSVKDEDEEVDAMSEISIASASSSNDHRGATRDKRGKKINNAVSPSGVPQLGMKKISLQTRAHAHTHTHTHPPHHPTTCCRTIRDGEGHLLEVKGAHLSCFVFASCRLEKHRSSWSSKDSTSLRQCRSFSRTSYFCPQPQLSWVE